MTDDERSRYQKTRDLRDAIWPASERASHDELRRWYLLKNVGHVRAKEFPYAFNSSGHPYQEYRDKLGIPYRRPGEATPETLSVAESDIEDYGPCLEDVDGSVDRKQLYRSSPTLGLWYVSDGT